MGSPILLLPLYHSSTSLTGGAVLFPQILTLIAYFKIMGQALVFFIAPFLLIKGTYDRIHKYY